MAALRDPSNEPNPYQPPASDALVEGPREGDGEAVRTVLAERGTRFWARLVDQVLLIVACVPAGIVYADEKRSTGDPSPTFWLLVLPIVALEIYQWYRISTSGQTLGKRWLGIRVVKMDDTPVGFLRGVFLREWVIAVAGFIPVAGSFVSLADAVAIFGRERRCIHDGLAGTKVVLAKKAA
jgi:uncharacterized RDD family membrane protein YckC